MHLEETIDILKLEALKELPQSEDDIKDEDISSDNLNDYEDMIMNDYESECIYLLGDFILNASWFGHNR